MARKAVIALALIHRLDDAGKPQAVKPGTTFACRDKPQPGQKESEYDELKRMQAIRDATNAKVVEAPAGGNDGNDGDGDAGDSSGDAGAGNGAGADGNGDGGDAGNGGSGDAGNAGSGDAGKAPKGKPGRKPKNARDLI